MNPSPAPFQNAEPIVGEPAPLTSNDHLVAFLSDRDEACPLCGYNLRGLTTPRCPECGRELRLSVGLIEPYLRAWIALAVGIFGAAGAGILFGAVVVHLGWPPGMPLVANVALSYFVGSPLLIWPTVAGRRRFMRLSKTRQTTIAAVALIVDALCVILLACDIR